MLPRRASILPSLLATALAAGAGFVRPATAQGGFPRITMWAFPGAWQDSTLLSPRRCVGAFEGPLADSVRDQGRTITLRIKRDPQAELRPDFGGYRIYRFVEAPGDTVRPDTAKMVLLRRYSLNAGDSLFMWHFSDVVRDSASPNFGRFMCGGKIASDSVITFVDPDSAGVFVKVCRRVDHLDRCLSPGDSVFRLIAPAGPHDGFRTWYAVTYEARNLTDNNYDEIYVPDTLDNRARCHVAGAPDTCWNLNRKRLNLYPSADASQYLEPTRGRLPDLLRVAVVPNPYRAREAWDAFGRHELHFINLPEEATIRIYTVSGDLVRVLRHSDPTRDFERWDLTNADGRDVASGIYMYRVEANVDGRPFEFQYRFVVIR